MATDRNLYQRCEHCPDENPGRLKREDSRGSSVILCPHCSGSGFWKIGLTMGQVEKLVDRDRALRGDPGLHQARAVVLVSEVEDLLRRLTRLGKPRENARELTDEEKSTIRETAVDSESR